VLEDSKQRTASKKEQAEDSKQRTASRREQAEENYM
jgi:hypothetical protein